VIVVFQILTNSAPSVFLCRERRLFSGLLTAVFAFFFIFAYLEPLFVPIGSEVAMVFLYLLGLQGAGVGMSLGVLLPSLFPGACFGASLVLLIGSFLSVSNAYFVPVVGGMAVLLFATASM
jgi:callose synthase